MPRLISQTTKAPTHPRGLSRGHAPWRLAQAFLAALLVLPTWGCGGTKKKSNEAPPNVVTPQARDQSVQLLDVQIPTGLGSYFTLGSKNFVNGSYNTDISMTQPPSGLDVAGEEGTAQASGIFLTVPGLLWSVVPANPVVVTMTAGGLTQTVKRQPLQNGKLAVSFMSFPSVFPPAYRQRYDLTIASVPGAAQPFSFNYNFAVIRSDAKPVYSVVGPGDGHTKLNFGQDTTGFVLATVTPSSDVCTSCVVSVSNLKVQASVKTFTELPALPSGTAMRITYPKRFTAMLQKQQTVPLTASINGNNTANLSISLTVPGSLTTVTPWCAAQPNPTGVCQVNLKGSPVPSYFRFMNAVPTDAAQQSLGGTAGVASLDISATATVTTTNAGNVVETKTVSLDSGIASPLDSATLPSWTLDDIRNSLNSGAPVFKQ